MTTDEVRRVAENERLSPDHVIRGVADGSIVILKNSARKGEVSPLGIGSGLRVKVNANVGTAPDICDVKMEVRKAKIAVEAGADTIMDLSVGGDLQATRRRLMAAAPIPFGTVPVYEAAVEARRKKGAIIHMSEDDIFNAVIRQAKDGVDFMTVHCGLTRESLESLIRQDRLLGIISRGGTFLASWIKHHNRENPLYENYDYLLEIAKEYDVTLSLGDALRPGCIHDATDNPQIHELMIIGRLVERARKAGVQSMVEGPGHVPLDQIEANVRLQKQLCKNAPFYVLGPLVTDVALGYDHIVGAIGGALAAYAGADYLCYVTPAEHVGLPDPQDVWEGVIVSRIAAHAADVARRQPASLDADYEISKARSELDWKKQFGLAIDPRKARELKKKKSPGRIDEVCTMCGEFCAIKLLRQYVKAEH